MLSYPLDLSFKIVTIGTRIRIKDATGRQVAYVRKKKLKLKEDVRVYEDENQSRLLFRMKADRMLDFSARDAISGPAPTAPPGFALSESPRYVGRAGRNVFLFDGRVVAHPPAELEVA